jgi:hypothetical protein
MMVAKSRLVREIGHPDLYGLKVVISGIEWRVFGWRGPELLAETIFELRFRNFAGGVGWCYDEHKTRGSFSRLLYA